MKTRLSSDFLNNRKTVSFKSYPSAFTIPRYRVFKDLFSVFGQSLHHKQGTVTTI
ncbi:hypothetical protein OHD16_01470 [Sphingobacterium sp. ML3W]|uniref:hypothetical protein n=1 Tax=Sphingobacterium sp. ML3W TaxID=1538644 RepID=UPI00249CE0FA|nr:hypothetical protein [Sphingobacterium sp. ML3W]WFA78654.1 hypothetical protein OGI71_21745 [Sphingobacterium sp. ML3W]